MFQSRFQQLVLSQPAQGFANDPAINVAGHIKALSDGQEIVWQPDTSLFVSIAQSRQNLDVLAPGGAGDRPQGLIHQVDAVFADILFQAGKQRLRLAFQQN